MQRTVQVGARVTKAIYQGCPDQQWLSRGGVIAIKASCCPGQISGRSGGQPGRPLAVQLIRGLCGLQHLIKKPAVTLELLQAASSSRDAASAGQVACASRAAAGGCGGSRASCQGLAQDAVLDAADGRHNDIAHHGIILRLQHAEHKQTETAKGRLGQQHYWAWP